MLTCFTRLAMQTSGKAAFNLMSTRPLFSQAGPLHVPTQAEHSCHGPSHQVMLSSLLMQIDNVLANFMQLSKVLTVTTFIQLGTVLATFMQLNKVLAIFKQLRKVPPPPCSPLPLRCWLPTSAFKFWVYIGGDGQKAGQVKRRRKENGYYLGPAKKIEWIINLISEYKS